MYNVCIKISDMNGVTTAIVQDKRIRKKDGTYAIKLRITFDREQKYYPLNVHLSPEDWEKVQSSKAKNKYKELQLYFNKIEERAYEVIKKIEPFSFSLFERNFVKKPKPSSKDILGLIQNHIEYLRKGDQIGTAETYRCTLSSISKFVHHHKRKKLGFHDITPEWLHSYEKWMLNHGRSMTTVSIYLRSLRAIFNMGLEEGLITKEAYPFGKKKYQIPASLNIKKALSLSDIKKIVEYKASSEAEEKARDLWLFSYLCNGANIKDIARLRYKNVSNKTITFIRAKTERTTRHNAKPIMAILIPETQAIIDKWGLHPRHSEKFIFGIIHPQDDPERERAKVKQTTKTINKYMKRIGEKLGLPLKLTTYTARHSFATVLKRSGASLEFISESLGHKDLRTTENYLDSFEDSVKEEFQKKLLDFD